TGVETNDVPFMSSFPYLAMPFSGTGDCSGELVDANNDQVDISLDVTVDNNTYTQFEEVAYTLTITNAGPRDASGVTVSAALPEGMVFTSAAATKGGYDLFNEVWNVGTLAAGETATLDLVLFTLVAGQDLTFFTQVVTATPMDKDSTPGNDMDQTPDEDDEAAVTITFASESTDRVMADVSISMDAPDNFSMHDNITFTISVSNEMSETVKDIKVKAGMVDGLSFRNATPTTGDYNIFKEHWTIDALEAGEQATLRLTGFAMKDSEAIVNEVEIVAAEAAEQTVTTEGVAEKRATKTVAAEQLKASVRIEPTTTAAGTKVENAAVLERIFPVPARSTLNLELETAEMELTTVAVYDVSGKKVLEQNVKLDRGFNQLRINVSQLVNGVYMVVLPLEGHGVVQEKFVKAAR
ncbi:MAG: T9SS type A sorting domain-containing protein, partial [Bacteroidota bacterium]